MKIAQVAPVYERVPPKRYGGIERLVSYLTEELVRQGHEVTLFASGDSITTGDLVSCCPKAIRDFESWVDPIALHALQLNQVFEREFEIVHFHIEYLAFPFTRTLGRLTLTTLHGPLPDMPALFHAFRDVPLVSVSNSQRAPFPLANWRKTIYHGLPDALYGFHSEPGRYLAFLGRIAPEKRCDRAIAIAKHSGIPLKIAAKIDPYDQAYFDAKIRPLLDDPVVEFIGEIGEHEKNEFLGNAMALLFPIEWEEPFGLVMIEALACGTPVIAYRHGSVPEIIQDGITGFVVDNFDAAVHAVQRIASISRYDCREAFETRFTVARMAQAYLSVYCDLVDASMSPNIKTSMDA
jgi:glycosyltransferase involved in cell wall biosynthesis